MFNVESVIVSCVFRLIFLSVWSMLITFEHVFSSGITNHDEYSLVRDIGEEKKEETTGTLKRDKTLLRDDKKMEKLKQKLHTDDECTSECHHTKTHSFYCFKMTRCKHGL